MLKDFKEFAFKGNLVDLAVGFILGAGFSAVVKSLVTNVIMPPIGILLGGVKFENLAWTLKQADEAAGTEAVTIKYGLFIDDLVAFTILALVVFIIVKKFIAAFEKEKAKPAPAAPPKQEVLLEEILAELKKNNG